MSRLTRPKGRRNYTVARLVGDVLALADKAGAERVQLVGHDWGGIVAWALASHHAARVASLASLATPHPAAFARSLVTSTQLLRSWYMFFYQLLLRPELSSRSEQGSKIFRRTLERSGLSARAGRYAERLRQGAAGPAVNWYCGLPSHPIT